MKISTSPLRYPGGKSSLTGFLVEILHNNNLLEGTYIEPFCGGAGAALNLLIHGYVKKIIINDIDIHIYAFWHSILSNPEKFIHRIESTPISVEEWYKQKNISKDADSTIFELGFSTFYLNRCNRSGILKANPIGGLKQTSRWKIDARYNKRSLIKRIEVISKFRESIRVENKDAILFLENIFHELKERSFIYLDPPYVEQGPGLYLNALTERDHATLAKILRKETNHVWLLTYDNSEKVKMLYGDANICPFSLCYSAHKHKQGKELLIYPYHTVVRNNFSINGELNRLTFLNYSYTQ